MLLIPALSDLMKMVSVPVTTRSISKLRDGMVTPCASMIIGTRRTMPSRSGLIVNRPRPAAASSSTGTLRSRPGNSNMKGCGSSPSIASPVTGRDLSSSAVDLGKSGFAEHHARMPHRIGENLIVARQRPQLGAGFLIEIAEGIGRDVGIEPVGLGEHDVEGDHDGAEFGQVGDHVRDPRSRPRPLAELGQSFGLVDVDDGDRRLRELGAGIEALEAYRRS